MYELFGSIDYVSDFILSVHAITFIVCVLFLFFFRIVRFYFNTDTPVASSHCLCYYHSGHSVLSFQALIVE